jgi:hypothetical protein
MYAVKSSHIRKSFDQIIVEVKEDWIGNEVNAYCIAMMELLKTRILSEEVYVSLQEPA